MSVEELIERLRSHMGRQEVPILLKDCRLAADKLEELAAERDAWEARFWKRDAQADRATQQRDAAEAHAQKLREALEQVHADAVGIGRGENAISDRARTMVDKALALTPEPPERQAGAQVKVEPLGWEMLNEGISGKRFWRAYPPVDGPYWIEMHPSSEGFEGQCAYAGRSFENVEDAKSAAQADYERRILSALTTEATNTGGGELKPNLDRLLKQAKGAYEAMTPEKKEEMKKAQLESWMRGMAPCEHGVRDWETCPDCRKAHTGGDSADR